MKYFEDYARQYTDMPLLVVLDGNDGKLIPGLQLRADDLKRQARPEKTPEWKTVGIEAGRTLVSPNG